MFGCSLKTRLADQTKTQQLMWLWSKDSMNSTINLRVVEQTQETNFELEGSGGSTLVTPCRAKVNTKQINLLSQAACSIKQGNKGRLKAFLLTVSNYSLLSDKEVL